MQMTPNVEYVIIDDEIKIVDNDTGVIKERGVWQNGLHQFLELKHGKFVQSEKVVSNWLSNITLFKKYDKLIGMTGTLGSEHCRNILWWTTRNSNILTQKFQGGRTGVW